MFCWAQLSWPWMMDGWWANPIKALERLASSYQILPGVNPWPSRSIGRAHPDGLRSMATQGELEFQPLSRFQRVESIRMCHLEIHVVQWNGTIYVYIISIKILIYIYICNYPEIHIDLLGWLICVSWRVNIPLYMDCLRVIKGLLHWFREICDVSSKKTNILRISI